MIEPLHSIDSWSSALTESAIPSNCFLSDVIVFDVDLEKQAGSGDSFLPNRMSGRMPIAEAALASGAAEITTKRLPMNASSAIAIPVHRGDRIVSVVTLLARKPDATMPEPLGVFEIWEPIGPYQEVSLKDGFYGPLERFQNVSSFVRFEKGNGLPGLVWDQRCAVIHDALADHPGFLRAAGASADSLSTAVGIPIACDQFYSAAVLISSASTPIARGMEVWSVRADANEFELTSAAYRHLGEDYPLPVGTVCSGDKPPFDRLRYEKRAMVTDRPNDLLAGRSPDAAVPGPASGLAIPFFDGLTLTSITLFLF